MYKHKYKKYKNNNSKINQKYTKEDIKSADWSLLNMDKEKSEKLLNYCNDAMNAIENGAISVSPSQSFTSFGEKLDKFIESIKK